MALPRRNAAAAPVVSVAPADAAAEQLLDLARSAEAPVAEADAASLLGKMAGALEDLPEG